MACSVFVWHSDVLFREVQLLVKEIVKFTQKLSLSFYLQVVILAIVKKNPGISIEDATAAFYC